MKKITLTILMVLLAAIVIAVSMNSNTSASTSAVIILPCCGTAPYPTDIQWNPVSGASSYHLQVAYDGGFSSLLFDQSGITLTKQTVNTSAGIEYYARVKANNEGSFGPVISFTTWNP